MSSHSIVERLKLEFRQHFGGEPDTIVRAPGRVNLIGEHTDYNDGFVMPLAIEHAAWMAARVRADRQVVLYSLNFNAEQRFSLDQIMRANGEGEWSNYTRGVAHILQVRGETLRGVDAVVWGDVPIGAGLSSSAALEVASLLTLATLSRLALKPQDVALLAQRAEIEFVGVNCGIMDQLISVLGQADHALLIDCRSLELRPVRLPDEVTVVIADTMKRRELVSSAYNERRRECEVGAQLLGVSSLRDVSLEMFEREQSRLPDVIRMRCRHVISENMRVLKTAEALSNRELELVGQLLYQSHQSLRDDYEVSCAELDLMVNLAMQHSAVLGARMTGAGFGGCTVNLVRQQAADQFGEWLAAAYHQQTGWTPDIYRSRAANGAELVLLNSLNS